MSQLSERYETHVFVHQEGPSATGQVATTISDMIRDAARFPGTVTQENAQPFLVETIDYFTVPLPPQGNPIDIQNQKDTVNRLGKYRYSLFDLLGSIDDVRLHQDYYVDPNMTDLNNKADQISDLINQVYHAASTCFNDYQHCNLLTDMSIPPVNLPQLKPGVTPAGGVVTIPNWKWDPDWSDDSNPNSAASLGLTVQRNWTPYDGQFGHYLHIVPGGINPPPGTKVTRGSMVTLTEWGP